MNKATLRLFNAIQVEDKENNYAGSHPSLERTLRHGYILDYKICTNDVLLKEIEEVVGLSGEKANAAFHKSWVVMRDSSNEELLLQQLVHYFTTYGFETLGVYNENTVYIPAEELDIPDAKDVPITVIHGLTADEILIKIIELGSFGVALSEETLSDIVVIVETNKYNPEFIREVKSRELKTRLLDFYHLVPDDPEGFLRYLVSKLTDESLIIKNDYLIEKIKAANGKFLDELLKDAPANLAEIFFRYKPLFLAMKTISRNKTFFNRLRKQANKIHKPLKPDYLNAITAQIKNKELDLSKLEKRLESATFFRKVRLLNALNFRIHSPESIVYRVRNGKGWATDFDFRGGNNRVLLDAMKIVGQSIISEMDIDGKVFYIPVGVEYTLPVSEKQFVGNLPSGTSFSVDEDLIVGIYWKNNEQRVDLDFSAINTRGKIGWDSAYRTRGRTVMFSGDVTDAPNGASELFYFAEDLQSPYIMNVNYFNFSAAHPVDSKLFVASHKPENLTKNYVVDPNCIVSQANIKLDQKQTSIGLVYKNTFYVYQAVSSNQISSRLNDVIKHSLNYMIYNLTNSVRLSKILIAAGAEVTRKSPDEEYIDLSPEALDKSTILNLFLPT